MLDSIYRMTLKLFCYHLLGVKTSIFCHIYATLLWALFHKVTNLTILIHGVISIQDIISQAPKSHMLSLLYLPLFCANKLLQ